MKEITNIKIIRERQLGILQHFDDICSQYNLQYYLSCGTLLGAIRHHGYIPWDDDIDIMMMREDYEKLLSKQKAVSDNKYYLCSPYDKSYQPYPYTYLKLFDLETTLIEMPSTKRIKSHIYIDIFPIDGLPNTEKRCKKFFFEMAIYKKMYRLFSIAKYNLNYKHGIKKNFWQIIYTLSAVIKPAHILNKMETALHRISCENATYKGIVVAGLGLCERVHKDIYSPVYVLFEGKEYPAPLEYDKYLKSIYGDYMEFPPLKEQKRTHDYKAYYNEEI